MPKAPVEMTVSELERMLNARRSALQELTKRRAKVQKELNKIDQEIHVLTGTSGRNGGRRTRNKQSLREIVLDLLKKNKKGYTLADLSRMILDSGYKTMSSNFRNVLYQSLYNTNGIYHDEASRTYRYQEPAPKTKPLVSAEK